MNSQDSNQVTDVEVPIEKCFVAFEQSFNRVKYFSSMANNLDVSTLPSSWDIKNRDGLFYRVNVPNEQQKRMLVDGYKHSLHCYLVRDCIESFAISLDEFFFILLINGKRIKSNKSFVSSFSKDECDSFKEFEKAGLCAEKGKIQLLKLKFGIELSPTLLEIAYSLKDIRNCFSHGNGFVRNTDGKKDEKQKRKFSWKTISVFAVGVDSNNMYPVFSEVPFPEAVNICLKIDDHPKVYDVGSQLSFSSDEAYEIGFSLQQIAHNLIQEAGNKLNCKKS